MDSEQAKLTNLHDIVLPDPVPIWPPDTGGILLLCALLLCVLMIGLHKYLRWRRNRYRRAGIEILEQAATVQDTSVVLKRVALAAYPREQVASLYGADWVAFLNGTCPRTAFDPHAFSVPAAPPSADLLQSATAWIKGHEVKAGRDVDGVEN